VIDKRQADSGGPSTNQPRKIPRLSDVLATAGDEAHRIDVRIEISLCHLDPPEGLAVRIAQSGNGPMGEPRAFVGWLGLFGVLQSLVAERVDRPLP
jgi:hypothetical protein